MEKKMTKAEKFAMILNIEEVKNNEMLKAFIEHEIELLNKKSNNKTTKKNEENEKLKEEIAFILKDFDDGATVTEIVKLMDGDWTNQKISALVNQMVKSGLVEKITEKSKSKFKLI